MPGGPLIGGRLLMRCFAIFNTRCGFLVFLRLSPQGLSAFRAPLATSIKTEETKEKKANSVQQEEWALHKAAGAAHSARLLATTGRELVLGDVVHNLYKR